MTVTPTEITTAGAPRLTRSRDDAWLGGVCGGIAARWNLDPALVRALFVVSILLPGPQVLIYLALWIIIPREPVHTATPLVTGLADTGLDDTTPPVVAAPSNLPPSYPGATETPQTPQAPTDDTDGSVEK